jgi:hypothetical protein
MTMYQGRSQVKKRKLWPIVVALGVLAVCGVCGVGVVTGIVKGGDLTSSTTAVGSSATVGQPVSDGGMRFVVEKVDCSATQLGPQLVARKAQGKFCVVSLAVTNTGKSAATFPSSAQRATDAAGAEYSPDDAAALLVTPEAWMAQINPGSTMRGVLVFDVPAPTMLTQVVLHDGMFSGGVRVNIG